MVIMDNLSPHKNEPTLALIAKPEPRCSSLPPYSPDLNPIEKMWSKVKAPCAAPKPAPSPISFRPLAQRWPASRPRMPGIGLPLVAIVLFKML